MAWPISYEDVLEAERRIRPFLAVTPLREYAALDAATGARVLVKHENHQPTCAFKVRNGLAAVTALSAEERARGVVCASTGNHGQGVAWAGRALSVAVTVCVPAGANPEKLTAMRGLGATIVEQGADYDAAVAAMQQLALERSLVEIHGVNHRMMPAGAGTMTLEIVRQVEAMKRGLDVLIVAVGGGSQAVGAMTVLRALRPGAGADVEVIGVQAAGAATIHDAWQAARRRRGVDAAGGNSADGHGPGHGGAAAGGGAGAGAAGLGPPVRTFAEGLATRSVYELTFGALCEGLTDLITVSDEEMATAMRLMLRATHNLVEPAGAAGLAGLLRLRERLAGRQVVIVNCGANVDQTTLRAVLTGNARVDLT